MDKRKSGDHVKFARDQGNIVPPLEVARASRARQILGRQEEKWGSYRGQWDHFRVALGLISGLGIISVSESFGELHSSPRYKLCRHMPL